MPEGGPYKVSVSGYGCSYPFGVGADFSRRLGHVSFRALYYQRCGCPLVKPYAWADLRVDPCHTLLYDTDARLAEANLTVRGDEPQLPPVYGGYHDAGDTDRRLYHLSVPVVLLTTYEVFPQIFTDDQFNIPDIFDANFNTVGHGTEGNLMDYLRRYDVRVVNGVRSHRYESLYFDTPALDLYERHHSGKCARHKLRHP